MRLEISPNQWSIRVYEDDDRGMTYNISALVRTYGDVAWISQISSPRWFEPMLDNFEHVLETLHVKSLEGPMNPAMARALRMQAKGRAKITIVRQCEFVGRTMPYVKCELPDKE